MAKRAPTPPIRRAKARRAPVTVRTLTTPVESYADVHGDAPPYHDTHDDDGTYYDHPDNEHNDFHHDETSALDRFRGDPAVLVSQAIERLSNVMTQFAALQRERLEKHTLDIATRLDSIEKKLDAKQRVTRGR